MRKPLGGLLGALACGFALAACSGGAAAGSQAELLVAEFFDHLENGDAAAIEPLLAADAPLRTTLAPMLTDEVYDGVIERPSGAEVTGTTGPDAEGIDTVRTEYTIGGQDRELMVKVRVTGDGAGILTWGSPPSLIVEAAGMPGALEINGVYRTEPLTELRDLTALPGRYEVTYVDPAGIGTVDATGGAGSAEIEFPPVADPDTASFPPGIGLSAVSLYIEPEPSPQAIEGLITAVGAVTEECTAAALAAPPCPAELIAKIHDGGAPEAGSVEWELLTPPEIVADSTWRATAHYRLSFNDDAGATAQNVTFTGTVENRDGAITFTAD